jgi:hypothetical protein
MSALRIWHSYKSILSKCSLQGTYPCTGTNNKFTNPAFTTLQNFKPCRNANAATFSTSTSKCSSTSTTTIVASGAIHHADTDFDDITPPSFLLGHDENTHADNFFRNSSRYRSTVFDITKLDENQSHQSHPPQQNAAVQRFIQTARNPENSKDPVVSETNLGVIHEVLANLKSLSDPELLQVIYHLRFFASCSGAKHPDYIKIWSALDKECVSRMSRWNFDYLFTVADLWYGLYLSRLSEFHWNLMKKCFRKCDKLSNEQFIRFMFFLNLQRRIPESISTYDMEFYLGNIADKLSSTEVAIVSLAFFKTQTVVKDSKVLEKLLDIVAKDASQLDSISVAAVAKFARYCSNVRVKDALIRFQEAFLPEVGRLSIPAATHLALVGTKIQVPLKELISSVVRKVEDRVKEARLKELERISLAMTMFNVECSNLGSLIVQELRSPERHEEIRMYGRCLPAILHYLSIIEILPEDLISKALAEGFRKTYYGR